ncbi:uncharacterized protein LOC124674153 [Lolium rigidum]|uniref:uncharacterized protein LOC124674153 n=1 Tax=Lolium rigidum TaxID=89674 RepID=UPI001F5E29C1|nr:uncharacterized protein LOC124674153 [Lolium rigidum]
MVARDKKKREESRRRDLLMKMERLTKLDLPTASTLTMDAPLPYPREAEKKHVAGSASGKMDLSLLEEPLEATTSELTPPILAVNCNDWGISFYIRTDGGGYLHTYPDVGGPFKTLQDAREAIDTFLRRRQDPTMFMDGLSYAERSVKWTLYWPDGTRKTPSKSQQVDLTRNWTYQLAHALMDGYNEKHSLTEDRAHQVKEVVCIEAIFEGDVFKWYNHINFTTRAKGDHGITTNLFFAEVISTKGELEELAPSCLRMLEPSDNGMCHGCQNNGSGEHMKHPKDASAYTGGHMRDTVFFKGPGLPPMEYPVDEDELHRAEEARLRAKLTAYEDASVFEKFKGPQPGPFLVRKPLVETEEMRQFWSSIYGS